MNARVDKIIMPNPVYIEWLLIENNFLAVYRQLTVVEIVISGGAECVV